ncbi:hypothetical protein COCVIDRAFT_100563, partial [Bipolaris victoriae FI3]
SLQMSHGPSCPRLKPPLSPSQTSAYRCRIVIFSLCILHPCPFCCQQTRLWCIWPPPSRNSANLAVLSATASPASLLLLRLPWLQKTTLLFRFGSRHPPLPCCCHSFLRSPTLLPWRPPSHMPCHRPRLCGHLYASRYSTAERYIWCHGHPKPTWPGCQHPRAPRPATPFACL